MNGLLPDMADTFPSPQLPLKTVTGIEPGLQGSMKQTLQIKDFTLATQMNISSQPPKLKT